MVALRRAEAATAAFRDQHMVPAERAYSAVRGRWPASHDFATDPEASVALRAPLAECERCEDRLGALESAQLAAVKRLLLTPAPDLSALALKIALAVDHEVTELDGGDRCLVVLKADAWTLAGREAV